jgi:hypothetical protein
MNMVIRWSDRLCLSLLALLIVSICARSAEAANSISYIGAPPPPVSGVLLPEVPSDVDPVVFRSSLGFTFTNGCFAAAANGTSTIVVNSTDRTISVGFDESTATLFPFCTGEFAPVSVLQIQLDPLPPGDWTLQVDEMLSIFQPVPAQEIEFAVQSSASEVPTGGRVYLAAIAMLLTATSIAIQRKRSDGRTAV